MKRRNVLFIFVSLICFCSLAFSQEKSAAVKIDEYDANTESPDVFDAKVNSLVQKLSQSPKMTTAMIVIANDDESISLFKDLAARAQSIILNRNSELKDRVEIPGIVPVGYRPSRIVVKTEFWLVPEKAESPYRFEVSCGLVYCSELVIEGTDYVYDKNKTRIFVAAGGPVSNFKWTISAGAEIIDGQNTSQIEVDFSRVIVDEVTITLEIDNNDSICPTKFTHKVKIAKNSEIVFIKPSVFVYTFLI